MTGLSAVLLLALACWLMRLSFIVFVPPARLPAGVTSALGQLAPAVLAALVSVETVGVVRGDALGPGLMSLACVAVIAAVAYRYRNLTISALLGLTAVMLIDLILT